MSVSKKEVSNALATTGTWRRPCRRAPFKVLVKVLLHVLDNVPPPVAVVDPKVRLPRVARETVHKNVGVLHGRCGSAGCGRRPRTPASRW